MKDDYVNNNIVNDLTGLVKVLTEAEMKENHEKEKQ